MSSKKFKFAAITSAGLVAVVVTSGLATYFASAQVPGQPPHASAPIVAATQPPAGAQLVVAATPAVAASPAALPSLAPPVIAAASPAATSPVAVGAGLPTKPANTSANSAPGNIAEPTIQRAGPGGVPAAGMPGGRSPNQVPNQGPDSTTAANPGAHTIEGDQINEDDLAKDSTTEINVKNAEIGSIIRIFSKKTKRNYILDERVKGKVSIYLPGRVSSDESIRILDSVLALKGFTAVPIGENIWKILPSKEARQSTIRTVTDENMLDHPSATMVTRIINLKFANADDVKQLITPLVSPDGLVNSYPSAGSIIVIDLEDNIDRLINIINSLDVPFSDRDMTIIPVKHADAVDISTKLNEILGTSGGGGGGQGGAATGQGSDLDLIRARIRDSVSNAAQMNAQGGVPSQIGGAASTGAAGGSSVGSRVKEPKIIPDERTNAIIVVADEDTTARIKALVSQLDSEVDLSGNKFYVYHCQHANATELADVLSNMVGGGGSSSSSVGSDSGTDSGFGGGSSSRTNRSGSSASRSSSQSNRSSQQRTASQTRTPGQSRNTQSTGAKSASGKLTDEISITADPATNSLVIHANKNDYQKILSLLQELDIKRKQVLVEAMLLEVAVNNSVQMGMQFLASAGGADGGVLIKNDFNNNLSSVLSDPTKIQAFSIAAASSGTLTLPGGISIPTQTMLMEAASSNASVNVLSAPTILATDNEQAEIVVGQNVPFIASTASNDTNLNNTFNQVDRQDVGITLRLTPHISSSETVSLQIFTEVSALVTVTLASSLGPTTTIRTSETTVIARDGQMIVIGGLISDNNDQSESGVPFLKDIPLLGHLFKSTTEGKERRNLLIFITPRIVSDQFDARETTINSRNRMDGEIRGQDLYPEREEILHSVDIDRAPSSTEFTDEKPGTILPPDRKAPNHASIEPNDRRAGVSQENNGPIELDVSPELPALPRKTSNDGPPPSTGSQTTRARLAEPSQASDGSTYIVFEAVKGSKIPDGLPFAISKKSSIFLAVLPNDSAPQARSFFEVGQSYFYLSSDKRLKTRPLGMFNSLADAKEMYPGVDKFAYTLSPYELLNIGNGPWVKESSAN